MFIVDNSHKKSVGNDEPHINKSAHVHKIMISVGKKYICTCSQRLNLIVDKLNEQCRMKDPSRYVSTGNTNDYK